MMIKIENEDDIWQSQWNTLWKELKASAAHILGNLRVAANRKFDQEYQARCRGAFATIVKAQPELEKIIAKSGEETGWVANPIPSVERLIKAVVELDELEFEGIPEQLEHLKRMAEDIMTLQ
jgi:hypothetical protein